MTYDNYRRDARAFGFAPAPAYALTPTQTDYLKKLLREESLRAWRYQQGLSIAMIAAFASAAVAVVAVLL